MAKKETVADIKERRSVRILELVEDALGGDTDPAKIRDATERAWRHADVRAIDEQIKQVQGDAAYKTFTDRARPPHAKEAS